MNTNFEKESLEGIPRDRSSSESTRSSWWDSEEDYEVDMALGFVTEEKQPKHSLTAEEEFQVLLMRIENAVSFIESVKMDLSRAPSPL